jgi:1,2-dihydroxy-3-keto-5-methylthiopentene dioxygenase
MSMLRIYDETAREIETISEYGQIAEVLAEIDVAYERWDADRVLAHDASQEDVLAAYAPQIERLTGRFDFQSMDVVALYPDHPQAAAMRGKFLDEHTHDDFEIRFFVEGSGVFYLHVGERVYAMLCTQGDLISVPAGTRHWFDMGAAPHFKCIRFFTTPEGWVGNFTGSDIARKFPDFDALKAAA